MAVSGKMSVYIATYWHIGVQLIRARCRSGKTESSFERGRPPIIIRLEKVKGSRMQTQWR
jgi:hypothetical protein